MARAKKEILQDMIASGDIQRIKRSELWKEAFAAYTDDTGISLSFTCNKCYKKVSEWLRK